MRGIQGLIIKFNDDTKKKKKNFLMMKTDNKQLRKNKQQHTRSVLTPHNENRRRLASHIPSDKLSCLSKIKLIAFCCVFHTKKKYNRQTFYSLFSVPSQSNFTNYILHVFNSSVFMIFDPLFIYVSKDFRS